MSLRLSFLFVSINILTTVHSTSCRILIVYKCETRNVGDGGRLGVRSVTLRQSCRLYMPPHNNAAMGRDVINMMSAHTNKESFASRTRARTLPVTTADQKNPNTSSKLCKIQRVYKTLSTVRRMYKNQSARCIGQIYPCISAERISSTTTGAMPHQVLLPAAQSASAADRKVQHCSTVEKSGQETVPNAHVSHICRAKNHVFATATCRPTRTPSTFDNALWYIVVSCLFTIIQMHACIIFTFELRFRIVFVRHTTQAAL